MRPFDYTIMRRLVDLLLAIPLWKCYGSADCVECLCRLFIEQGELGQIGTVICVVLVVKYACLIGGDLCAMIRSLWTGHKPAPVSVATDPL